MAEPTDKDTRGPVNLRIKFRSESLQQFIERYGVDVSRGGIFIRTLEVLPLAARCLIPAIVLTCAPWHTFACVPGTEATSTAPLTRSFIASR